MLNSIKKFFDEHLSPDISISTESEIHRLHLATAALLIEMMKVDDQIDDKERQIILNGLGKKFSLNESKTREIIKLAEAELGSATDYFQFTSLVNKQFSPEQKIKLVENMWAVAFADGYADQHEEHLVRKIAELIYVPHADFIAAKQRAEKLSQSVD